MLEDQYKFDIIKDSDIEQYKTDWDKVDTIKLILKHNKLSIPKFEELFQRLSATKIENLEIDLTDYEHLDQDRIQALVDCVRGMNLKTFVFLLSNVSLKDNQFNQLIYDTMENMFNLKTLYLELENVGMNSNKVKTLENLLSKHQNIKSLYINLKKNNLTKDDVAHVSKVTMHIPSRDIIF